MIDVDARSTVNASAPMIAVGALSGQPHTTAPAGISLLPAAIAATAKYAPPAFSLIVLAGFVRVV